tara:strand:- start:483 stop:2558 length:2076 start_codon:yes stop_codon:yes gene_type:complete
MDRYQRQIWNQKSSKITTGTGEPDSSEGSNGAITIRDINGKVSLFAKVGGAWHGTGLGPTETLGERHLTHLTIDDSGINAMDGSISIAQFGETLRIGEDSSSKSALRVAADGELTIGTNAVTNFRVDSNGTTTINSSLALTGTSTKLTVHASDDTVSYNQESAIFLGLDDSTPSFSIRGTGTNSLTWNGSVLTLNCVAALTSGSSYAGNEIGLAYTAATDDSAADAAQDAIDAMEAQVVLGDTQIDIMTENQSPSDFKLARFGSTIYLYDGTASENVKLEVAAAGIKLYGDNATTYTHVDSNGIRLYDNSVLAATFQAGGAIIGPVADDTSRLILTGGALQFVNRQGTTDTVTAQLTDAGVFNVANINLTGQINITSSGTRNVVIGVNGNDLGSKNIAIGVDAGAALTATSTQNTLIGDSAGKSLEDGQGNICIGDYAGTNITDSGLNIAIGRNSLLDAGTTDGSLSSSSNQHNVGVGYASLQNLDATTSSEAFGNVAVGSNAGDGLTTGNYNICIGYGADLAGGTDSGIVIGAASGEGVFSGSADRFTFGMLGEKIYSSTFDTGTVSWSQTSDIRRKQDIKDDVLGLNFINKLRNVTFRWKPQNEFPEEWDDYSAVNRLNTDKVHHGLIAQEVKQALDECNIETFKMWEEGEDGKQFLSIGKVVLPLIKAVQELSAKIDTMQTEINSLKG